MKETVMILSAGAPEFRQPLAWYAGFEQWLNWKSLGTVTATGKSYNDPNGVVSQEKLEEARKLGASIH